MNSKGKDRGRLRPPGEVMLARSERARSPGSLDARPGESCAALLGQLQCPGLRRTPLSFSNYGCSLPPGPFPLKLCGAVWSRGLGLGGQWGGRRLVEMGICRSKWGARGEIWVGQWRAGRGGAPRSGTTGRPPGLTSEVPALVSGPGGPDGSLSPYPRWRPERLLVPVSGHSPQPPLRSQGSLPPLTLFGNRP